MKLVAVFAHFLAQFDPTPQPVNPALPPLVLVHGILCDENYMLRMTRYFQAQGREVYAPSLKPNNGSAKLEDLAAQLRDFVDKKLPGRRFDLVAHSMGGLVSRYYVQRLGGDARVRQLITMATPNHGTLYSHFLPGTGVRQMHPKSDFLQELNADTETWKRVPLTNFYTSLDLVIIPYTSSLMPGGRNIKTWALTHPSYIISKAQFRAVGKALESSPGL